MKKFRSIVIPAKAGIQPGYQVALPGFRAGDERGEVIPAIEGTGQSREAQSR